MKIMLFILWMSVAPDGSKLIHINTHEYKTIVVCEASAKKINDRHLIVNGEPVKAQCFEELQ